MNICFNRIELDGFMSFDHEELDIQNLGVVTLSGKNLYEPLAESNGSGKSALSESILWCLTGFTSRGATDVSNSILNKGVYVIVDLDIDTTNYIILRARNHCDYGTTLKITKNGEDISGSTTTKSKTILSEELNHLDYDTLTSIIILSQGLPGRLSVLKPSSRKSRLEELSCTDTFIDALVREVSSASSDLLAKRSEITGKVIQSDTRSNTSSLHVSTNLAKIEEIKSKLSTTINSDEASKIESEIIPDLQKDIDHYNSQVRLLSSEKAQLSSKLQTLTFELTQKKSDNDKYMSQYMSYNSAAVPTCPTCHQPISNQSTLQSLRDKLNALITENKSGLSKLIPEIEQVTSRLQQISSDLDLAQESLSDYQAELRQYQSQLNDYKISQGSVSVLEEAIAKDNQVIAEEARLHAELTKQLSEIDEQCSIANYLKNQLSRKFRSFLLEGVISYINHKGEEYSPYLFEKQGVVHLEIDGNNINIYLGNRRFEDLSGGEGRRVDIILQIIQRDLARNESGFSSNLMVLDEILDNLDATGADAVLRLLEYKSPDISSMLIISHKPDINIPSDRVITVVKGTDQISKIQKSGV